MMFFLQLFFVLLSAADVGLTWHALTKCNGAYCEANPLADWIIVNWGWFGAVVFKALDVVLILFCLRYIKKTNYWFGFGLMTFACVVGSLVVGWSVYLLAE